MAGESAREVARRRREKADRLARTAELFERGAEGEEATAAALAALPATDWAVFHDIRWPGRRYANVDHVVVGPPGVFVVDSKNWSGSVVVRDQVLRQNGRSREPAVVGAAEAALAIAQLTREVPANHVHPVLCFVRDEPIAGWARDVMVCSTGNIVQMLLSRPVVLSSEQRRAAALDIDASTHAALDIAPARPVATAPAPRRTAPRRPHPATPAQPRRRSRGRRSRPGGPVKLGLVAAAVGAFLYVPGVQHAVTDGVTKILVPEQTSAAPVDDVPKRDKNAAKQNRD